MVVMGMRGSPWCEWALESCTRKIYPSSELSGRARPADKRRLLVPVLLANQTRLMQIHDSLRIYSRPCETSCLTENHVTIECNFPWRGSSFSISPAPQVLAARVGGYDPDGNLARGERRLRFALWHCPMVAMIRGFSKPDSVVAASVPLRPTNSCMKNKDYHLQQHLLPFPAMCEGAASNMPIRCQRARWK